MLCYTGVMDCHGTAYPCSLASCLLTYKSILRSRFSCWSFTDLSHVVQVSGSHRSPFWEGSHDEPGSCFRAVSQTGASTTGHIPQAALHLPGCGYLQLRKARPIRVGSPDQLSFSPELAGKGGGWPVAARGGTTSPFTSDRPFPSAAAPRKPLLGSTGSRIAPRQR